ncbi:hypothetical protein BDZ94DRAFT_1258266 [Collybia nuda]|uniref:Uncharacterized protein n=1 Tax=Collybia nuda TaxID=64659 RepID=A0A9P6CF88_9AGAR|nr:hypothetical protein BDZ94DRAFT_1258266 [Collybia nuda]
MSSPDLSKILTPSLYTQINKIQFPWDGPVDITFASQFYFRKIPDVSRQVYDALHHEALKPLSTFCPTIPDLVGYLPNPSDNSYPEHTLALVLLLDQAPRTLYTSLDSRYTYGFFDDVSKKLVKSLVSSGTLPDATERWTALGFSFEDVIIRKFWLYIPLVHSEDIADHEAVAPMLEQMRLEVEAHSGRKDRSRDSDMGDAKDTTLFPKLIREGPPKSSPEFFFWMFRLFRVHMLIIAEFGRYPYRNYAEGRDSTEREKEYLKLTEDFGRPRLTDTEVQKLKDDRKAGVWDELSDKGPW